MHWGIFSGTLQDTPHPLALWFSYVCVAGVTRGSFYKIHLLNVMALAPDQRSLALWNARAQVWALPTGGPQNAPAVVDALQAAQKHEPLESAFQQVAINVKSVPGCRVITDPRSQHPSPITVLTSCNQTLRFNQSDAGTVSPQASPKSQHTDARTAFSCLAGVSLPPLPERCHSNHTL